MVAGTRKGIAAHKPKTARLFERLAGFQRLGAGVDLRRCAFGVFGPGVDEAPLRWQELAVFVLDAHDPVRVGRRDVVARPVADEGLSVSAQL